MSSIFVALIDVNMITICTWTYIVFFNINFIFSDFFVRRLKGIIGANIGLKKCSLSLSKFMLNKVGILKRKMTEIFEKYQTFCQD